MPNDSETRALVEDVAQIMRDGYAGAKLVLASQATLLLPIEYITYRGYIDGLSYDWEMLLNRLFERYRGLIERYSAHRGHIGFYGVK